MKIITVAYSRLLNLSKTFRPLRVGLFGRGMEKDTGFDSCSSSAEDDSSPLEEVFSEMPPGEFSS